MALLGYVGILGVSSDFWVSHSTLGGFWGLFSFGFLGPKWLLKVPWHFGGPMPGSLGGPYKSREVSKGQLGLLKCHKAPKVPWVSKTHLEFLKCHGTPKCHLGP